MREIFIATKPKSGGNPLSVSLSMMLMLSLPKLAALGILAPSLVAGMLSASSESHIPLKSVRT